MTASEFMDRAAAAIDQVGLACAHAPDHVAEGILGRWSADLRAGWRKTLPWLDPRHVDTAVDDVIDRARIRRREIERSPTGTA